MFIKVGELLTPSLPSWSQGCFFRSMAALWLCVELRSCPEAAASSSSHSRDAGVLQH